MFFLYGDEMMYHLCGLDIFIAERIEDDRVGNTGMYVCGNNECEFIHPHF